MIVGLLLVGMTGLIMMYKLNQQASYIQGRMSRTTRDLNRAIALEETQKANRTAAEAAKKAQKAERRQQEDSEYEYP